MSGIVEQINTAILDDQLHYTDQNVILAFHRRSNTIITYSQTTHEVIIYECKSFFTYQWNKIGHWQTNTIFRKIVSVIALESYNVFAIVGSNEEGTILIFLSFNGEIRLNHLVSDKQNINCAEYNQKTREFILGFENSVILCLYTKLTSNYLYVVTVKKAIQLASDEGHKPAYLYSQDLVDLVLILTKQGSILCLDLTKFEIVYSISSDLFALPPHKLWVDKFGLDFVVQCNNLDHSKEQLEYWHPPIDYTGCKSHLFGRITIPISAQVLSINFESIGLDAGKTLLGIVTFNRRYQLWSSNHADTLIFESDCYLNAPNIIWESIIASKYSEYLTINTYFPTIPYLDSIQTFISPTNDMSNFSTISFLTLKNFSFLLGIHLSTKYDNNQRAFCLEVEDAKAIMALETQHEIHMNMKQEKQKIKQSHGRSKKQAQMTNSLEDIFPLPPSSSSSRQAMNHNQLQVDTMFPLPEDTSLGNEEDSSYGLDENQYQHHLLYEKNLSYQEEHSPILESLPSVLTDGIPPQHPLDEVPDQNNDDVKFEDSLYSDSDSVISLKISNSKKSNEPNVQYFPEFYFKNMDINQCKIIKNRYISFVQPYDLLFLDDTLNNILSFNLNGMERLDPLQPIALSKSTMTIEYLSIAQRIGHALLISNLKDAFLCNLNAISSKPLRLLVSIKHECRITFASCVDVLVLNPSQTNPSSSLKPQPSTIDPFTQSSKYTMVLLGDDQGFIHIYLCDSANSVLQSTSFKAHTSPITHLIPTGDATRPLWIIGTEYQSSSHVIPISIAGSTFVSVSADGTVKTWQPLAQNPKPNVFDRVLSTCILSWKTTGIFNYERKTKVNKKIVTRDITTVALSPTCINLILGFSTGHIEEWNIPGILGPNESTLDTIVTPFWQNDLHKKSIVSLRVCVHSPLSNIKTIRFTPEVDRNSTLSTLASYIKTSTRARYTIGYTFQDMKMFSTCSSMVSTSYDNSLILWTFQSKFQSFCSYATPIPCKRFYFSWYPSQGLSYCIENPATNPYNGRNIWKVDTVINGRIVTVIEGSREKLFQIPSTKEQEDGLKYFPLIKTTASISFDDELMYDRQGQTATKRSGQCLVSIPTVGAVAKSSRLVNSYQAFNKEFEASSQQPTNQKAKISKDSNTTTDLKSINLLEEWAKLDASLVHPVLAVVQYDDQPVEIKTGIVSSVRPETPSKVNSKTMELENPQWPVNNPRPLTTETKKETDDNLAKVQFNGLHLAVEPQDMGDTIQKLKDMDGNRFILEKDKISPTKRRLQSPSRDYEMEIGPDGLLIMDDSLETSRPGTPDSEDSAATKSTTLSKISITYSKDDQEGGKPGQESKDSPYSPIKQNSFNLENDESEGPRDDISAMSGEYVPKLGAHETRTNHLRRQMQTKAKTRLELVDKFQGRQESGDMRRSTKHMYTSKTSIQKLDNDQFKHGVKQVYGNNSLITLPMVFHGKEFYTVDKAALLNNQSPMKTTAKENELIQSPDHIENPNEQFHSEGMHFHHQHHESDRINENEEDRHLHHHDPLVTHEDSVTPHEKSKEMHSHTSKTKEKLIIPNVFTSPSPTLPTDLPEIGPSSAPSTAPSTAPTSSSAPRTPSQPAKYILKKEKDSKPKIIQPTRSSFIKFKSQDSLEIEMIEASAPMVEAEAAKRNATTSFDDDSTIPPNDDHSINDFTPSKAGDTPKASTNKAPFIQEVKDEVVELAAPSVDTEDIIAILHEQERMKKEKMRKLSKKPPAPKPQEKISLDVPNKKKQDDLKRIATFAKNLEGLGANIENTKLQALATPKDNDQESVSSQDSVVTTFFDRTAKPIFVERKKPVKHVLVSKRHESSRKNSPALLSKRKDDDTMSDSETEDLDTLLDDLSLEERNLLAGLDEETRKKFLSQLKHTMGKGNKKAVGKNADILQQKTQEMMQRARLINKLKMDISVELILLLDSEFTISVASDLGGPAKSTQADTSSDRSFQDDKTITNMPGYVEHQKVDIIPKSYTELTFKNLEPESDYVLYALINRYVVLDELKMKNFNINDDANLIEYIKPKTLELKTTEEVLDIEWNRLSEKQRLIELKAAIRSEFVHHKAIINFPEPILLPEDNEISNEPFTQLLAPGLSLDMKKIIKGKLSKSLNIFYDWWVGTTNQCTKPRKEFHELESLQAIITSTKLINSFIEDGMCSIDDVQVLQRYARHKLTTKIKANLVNMGELSSPLRDSASGINSLHPLIEEKGLQLFKRFRSWYKGGYVMKEVEENERHRMHDSLTSQSLADANEGKATELSSLASSSIALTDSEILIPLPQKRMQERTEFLESLFPPIDESMMMIQRLYEGHKYAVQRKIKLDDLKFERAKVNAKDITSLMCGRKLIEIGEKWKILDGSQLFSPSSPLTTIDLQNLSDAKLSLLYPTFISRSSITALDFNKNSISAKSVPLYVILQALSGADLFRTVNNELLKPDEPPPFEIKTLPGTNRRPLKPWQSLSIGEQDLELCLACSLDYIVEIAIMDGIEIPEPEDRLVLTTDYPTRSQRWKAFRAWYVGQEDTEPIPGLGVPTLGRVLFSERFEAKVVEKDPYVLTIMKEKNFTLPKRYLDNYQSEEEEVSVEEGKLSISTPSSSSLESKAKNKPMENFQTLVQAYEQAISTSSGAFLRGEIISSSLNKIFLSRKMTLLKFIWPPGMNRTGWRFLFPRIGILIPRFELPLRRYHLFPSKSHESYNKDEILAWYSTKELDDEDMLMNKAETKGVKERAYHEWLAHEPERMEESRRMMAEEDEIAFKHRRTNQIIAERLAKFEKKLHRLDEDIDDFDSKYYATPRGVIKEVEEEPEESRPSTGLTRAISRQSRATSRSRFELDYPEIEESKPFYIDKNDKEKPNEDEEPEKEANEEQTEAQEEEEEEEEAEEDESQSTISERDYTIGLTAKRKPSFHKKFRFLQEVPQEYWYFFEESCEFNHGSGIYNDDEVEEMREKQMKDAERAREEAKKFETYLNEEKKKRDVEEKIRLKREEQDRRLREGMARRRQIRENLEEIKRQRALQLEEERLEQLRQFEEQRLETQRRMEEQKIANEKRKIEETRQEELRLMALEDELVRELKIRTREIKSMEHEDIVSFLADQIELRKEQQREIRMKQLQELYTVFEPYDFNPQKIKLKELHDLLRNEHDHYQDDSDVDEEDEEALYYREVMNSLEANRAGSQQGIVSSASVASPSAQSNGTMSRTFSSSTSRSDTRSSMRKLSTRFLNLYGENAVSMNYFPRNLMAQGNRATSPSQGVINPPPNPDQNLIRRAKDHSPTKRRIHQLISELKEHENTLEHTKSMISNTSNGGKSLLPFNPYDLQWELNQPPPVLVGTNNNASSKSFFVRPTFKGVAASTLTDVKKSNKTLESVIPMYVEIKQKKEQEQIIPQETNGMRSFLQMRAISPLQVPATTSGSQYSPPSRSQSNISPSSPQIRQPNVPSSIRFDDSTMMDSTVARDSMTSTPPHELVQEESFFRSLAQVNEEDDNNNENNDDDDEYDELPPRPELPHASPSGRQQMKDLLAESGEIISKKESKEWLDYLKSQRRMTVASLTSILAKEEKLRLSKMARNPSSFDIKQLSSSEKIPSLEPTSSVPLLSKTTTNIPSTTNNINNNHPTSSALEKTPLDFKTYQMAKSASESVLKLQSQRDTLKQFVTSHAMLHHDKYYFMASLPGIRTKTCLQENDEIQKFQAELHAKLEKDDDDEHQIELSEQAITSQQQQKQSKKNKLTKPNHSLKKKIKLHPMPSTSSSSTKGIEHSTISSLTAPNIRLLSPVKSEQDTNKKVGAIFGNTMKLEKGLPSKKKILDPLPLPHDPTLDSELIRPSKSLDLFIKTPMNSLVGGLSGIGDDASSISQTLQQDGDSINDNT